MLFVCTISDHQGQHLLLLRHCRSESLMTSYLRMQAAAAEPEVATPGVRNQAKHPCQTDAPSREQHDGARATEGGHTGGLSCTSIYQEDNKETCAKWTSHKGAQCIRSSHMGCQVSAVDHRSRHVLQGFGDADAADAAELGLGQADRRRTTCSDEHSVQVSDFDHVGSLKAEEDQARLRDSAGSGDILDNCRTPSPSDAQYACC